MVKLHPFGGSNVSSKLPIVKKVLPGDERQGVLLGRKGLRFSSANSSINVDVVALDDFFRTQHLEHVYHVSIDTEGFDALVLEGMRNAVAQRRVSIVEFEVNNLGFWNRFQPGFRPIGQVLAMFDAARYSCFWVLPHSLLPANGACWLPKVGHGSLKWSNVVCAHEPEVVAALSSIATQGYLARQTALHIGKGATAMDRPRSDTSDRATAHRHRHGKGWQRS